MNIGGWARWPWLAALLLATPGARAAVEKDTRGWQQRSTTGPANQGYWTMSYAGNGKMVTLARAPDASEVRTWEYDGKTGVWTARTRNPTPPERSSYGFDYDSRRQRAVLFAGAYGDRYFNDVWEYDIVAGQWREVTPSSGPAPAPRRVPLWAYDPNRDRFVLLGGGVPQGREEFSNDEAWEWDGRSWTRYDDAPDAASAWDAVYVPTRGRVVAIDTDGSMLDWNGTNWFPVAHYNEALPQGPAFVYAGSGRLMSFGGIDRGPPESNTNATFESDGRRWHRVTPTPAPSPRVIPLRRFDPDRNVLVIHGGLQYAFDNPSGTLYPTDTWEYALSAFDLGSPCASNEPPRCSRGSCVDGVCCATACDGTCESCNVEYKEGQCIREVSASCPAPMPGTGGMGGAGGVSGTGGDPSTPIGDAGGTGGNGGARDAPTLDAAPDPQKDGPIANPPAPAPASANDASARPAPTSTAPAEMVRGLYAGSACSISPTSAATRSPPATWLLLAITAGLVRISRRSSRIRRPS